MAHGTEVGTSGTARGKMKYDSTRKIANLKFHGSMFPDSLVELVGFCLRKDEEPTVPRWAPLSNTRVR